MTAHVCADCGMLHDAPVQTESAEVQIARIQAESALAIAKLTARAESHVAEVEAETQVEVAEVQAEAVVVALQAEEEAPEEEAVEDPGMMSAPVVIAQDIDAGNEEDETAPPKAEEHQDEDEVDKPRKSRGLGLW